MKPEDLHIEATRTTPEYNLSNQGQITIKGRAIDESKAKAPEKFISWINDYIADPAEATEVSINLEFLNSFNTVILTSVLKRIKQVAVMGKGLSIRWYYEEDDTDLLERGKYISSVIGFPFEYLTSGTSAGN